ncbi:DASH complex subunit Dad3-domain-containing protein [Scheffersomyces coipomensis]|uniref:DASH complex subunit Dad3-domain-containing protein n=1 Tax=Scheffersomyces coipomensis TaxID=1788519 RepID=UPI00315D91F8
MSLQDLQTIDYTKSSQLFPIEGEILQQYQFLNNQLITLNNEINHLTTKSSSLQDIIASSASKSNGNAHVLLDNLRNLEMKIGLIHTLFKGAVYTLFLEQDNVEINDEQGEEEEEEVDENRNEEEEDADVTKGEIDLD